MTELARTLQDLGGGDLAAAFEEVRVPAVILDRDGVIRWMNRAGYDDAGPVKDCPAAASLVSGQSETLRGFLERILAGGCTGEITLDVILADGMPGVREFSVAPIRGDGTVLGVFALAASPPPVRSGGDSGYRLTARQLEILRLLADGKSTDQITEELHLAKTTVRNHIAHLLTNLGVHTRTEAVVVATSAGLIRMRRELSAE